MPTRPSPLSLLLTLGGSLILVTLGGAGWIAWTLREEAARWPTLADTPPVHAPTAPDAGDERAWALLAAAVDQYDREAADYSEILAAEGPPPAEHLGGWRAQAEGIQTLRSAVEETRGLSVPLPETLDAPGPDLLPILRLSEAWLLKAWSDAASGQPDLAVEEALRVQRLGARLIEGDSGLIGCMMGLAVHERARRELRELLAAQGEARPDLYARAAEGFAPMEAGAVARALVSEARMGEGTFLTLEDPGQAAETLNGGGPAAGWGYDPDLTVVWYRLQMQRFVDQAARPRWQRQPIEPELLWDPEGPTLAQRLHNPVGRILLDIATPSFLGMVDREDEAIASSRLDQIWIAARRHALLHQGRLPERQEDLVPAFMPAVLIDPFDGQPLRLSDGSAWSAGQAEDDPLRRAL